MHNSRRAQTYFKFLRVSAYLILYAGIAGCATLERDPAVVGRIAQVPVRILLTFDDGPSGIREGNPTESILDDLADNPIQRDIKAVFFLQTRTSRGGATELGHSLIVRQQAEGHVLALHDGSTLGHRSHRNLNDAELEKSLNDGIADLQLVRGRAVTLVRPPFWAYDDRTLAAYERHGLAMILTDVSSNDGKTWGFKASPTRFWHMAREMERVYDRIERQQIAAVDGVIPIIVTFHDTNTYTAKHMKEYLQMIIDKAHEAGLTLASPPFYDEANALEHAALVRASDVTARAAMVPWRWRFMQW